MTLSEWGGGGAGVRYWQGGEGWCGVCRVGWKGVREVRTGHEVGWGGGVGGRLCRVGWRGVRKVRMGHTVGCGGVGYVGWSRVRRVGWRGVREVGMGHKVGWGVVRVCLEGGQSQGG